MAVRLLPWKLLASVCSANQGQTLECTSSSFFGTLSAATPPTERMLPPPTLSTSLGNCLTFIARTGTCLCSTERLEHNGSHFYRLLSLLEQQDAFICCAPFSVPTNSMQQSSSRGATGSQVYHHARNILQLVLSSTDKSSSLSPKYLF
jgi:hypothetical protein